MIVTLIRHGESQANTGKVNPQESGDFAVRLSATGREQALAAGAKLGADYLTDCLIFCSPYRRTRETLACLLEGASVAPEQIRVYEDPRLREVEHGYHDVESQQPSREVHGWFYYRFEQGESPADCYDRTSGFLESLSRQVARKDAERVLVVTHGLTIRCFAMRWLHLTVEEFEDLANPENCDLVTIAKTDTLSPDAVTHTSGRWGVTGLRVRA